MSEVVSEPQAGGAEFTFTKKDDIVFIRVGLVAKGVKVYKRVVNNGVSWDATGTVAKFEYLPFAWAVNITDVELLDKLRALNPRDQVAAALPLVLDVALQHQCLVELIHATNQAVGTRIAHTAVNERLAVIREAIGLSSENWGTH